MKAKWNRSFLDNRNMESDLSAYVERPCGIGTTTKSRSMTVTTECTPCLGSAGWNPNGEDDCGSVRAHCGADAGREPHP